MKFGNQVVMFNLSGIPMVGNLNTGYAIGLTDDGAAICQRLQQEDIPDERIAAVDEALLQHLGIGGFFDNEQLSKGVASAYLHVTQRCNLTCVGCYSLDEQRNMACDATLEQMQRAIKQLAAGGISKLIISGGEPFLRDDLAEIASYAKLQCEIPCVVVLTNGTFVSRKQLKALAPFVDQVSVSFDGASPDAMPYIRGEQRFWELVEAVRAIHDSGIAAHILPTIHAENIGEIEAYLELAEDLDATINFSLLSCSNETEQLAALLPNDEQQKMLARKLIQVGKEKPLALNDAPIGANLTVKKACGAGWGSLSIASDGTVYPCHMLHRQNLAMGNLFEETIHEVLASDVGMYFRSLSTDQFGDCSGCDFERLCGGGCRARSLFGFDNLVSKDSYCSMMKEFFSGYGSMLKTALAEQRTRNNPASE